MDETILTCSIPMPSFARLLEDEKMKVAKAVTSTFKFRAECINDVDRLKGVLRKNGKKIRMTIDEEPPWIDVIIEMETTESLDDIKQAMRGVVDGHVMLQTIAPKDKYTGKRRYCEE